ncbi:suprabasin isoform X2 [Choloepus didactylus]|uniref:suprabasin isoform X2 n=1 Tax=Choloepus didactylus TaxID=27675 RepID=UPI00189D14FB|nr:suprabasin isoform X2 [Choloepus didactylus]
MYPATVVSSCFLLLLLGALPGWAATNDPIEKVIEGINRGLSNAEREGGHQGGYAGQHGGAGTTTLTSGASVNKPFINFPALWRSVTNIIP